MKNESVFLNSILGSELFYVYKILLQLWSTWNFTGPLDAGFLCSFCQFTTA